MKRFLILASGLGLLVALYYGTNPDAEKVEVKVAPEPQKKDEPVVEEPKHVVESHIVDAGLIHETNNNTVDADRDYLLWNKVSDEVEMMWDKEIYTHIQYIDRENSDLLYKYYLSERKDYLRTQDRSLAQSLNDLSRLNGESIVDEDAYSSPEMRHDEFTMKLRKLFRKQYSYIEDQRKIFLDTQK